jgi:pyruvate dehydrogenase E2 component (dihydrolipoamide acetyltransferase)
MLPMAKSINMPQVGQDILTGILTEWRIKVGDTVKKGDIVAVVESDKASFEVEAFESGMVLELLYNEGDEAKVFEPILYLGEPGESVETENTKVDVEEPQSLGKDKSVFQVEENRTTAESKIFSTPSARRIAREHGLDVAGIKGSGPNGRIIKQDILNAVEALKNREEKIADNIPSATQADFQSLVSAPDREEIPFSRMRQRIAEKLLLSKRTIPHFYLFMDVDMTDVLSWRSLFNKSGSQKISVNDILIKATAATLTYFPRLNAHVSDSKLILLKDINIGIAVSVEDGLLVPVIPNADKKNVQEISMLSQQLSAGAKMGILKSNAIGSFSISNLGMFSVNRFLPIINPPEVAILGVGKIEKRVVPLEQNAIGVREYLTLSLACDHRAVDGVYAANFLDRLKEFLEKFNF